MMYMPDALRGMVELMEADSTGLIHRNAFNVGAMSFNPEQLAAEIRRHRPNFEIEYQVDPIRQAIADSWPDSMDDSAARDEWGWHPDYDLPATVREMLSAVEAKLSRHSEPPAPEIE
jgi:nucleoside-diphosphate-sugar epimerase